MDATFKLMEQELLKQVAYNQAHNDPLMAVDFDIVEYFNSKYPEEASLENIVDEIKAYD